MATIEDFETAASRVKTLTKAPSNTQLLALYGYYKQATDGDVSGKRPGAFSMKARAKFDAWAENKGLSGDDARAKYVTLVDSLMG